MAAAAAAAARFKGRFAVHPLLPGAAQVAVDACTGRLVPAWRPQAEVLFAKWEKVSVCMSKYEEFRKRTNRKDIKKLHVFMNEEAQAKLAEFYLCCALRLRPDDIEAAGQDAQKLLEIARTTAEQEVEPFFEECRAFVKDYDEALHKRLDGTTIWREVDDSLFWHHSFEAAAPAQYAAFHTASLPPRDDWPQPEDEPGLAAALEACSRSVAEEGGQARQLAEEVYGAFLEASSMPVKGAIRTVLMDHGVIWG